MCKKICKMFGRWYFLCNKNTVDSLEKKQTSLSLQVTLMHCFKDVYNPSGKTWIRWLVRKIRWWTWYYSIPKKWRNKNRVTKLSTSTGWYIFCKEKKIYIYICKTLSRRRSPSESNSTMWVSKKGSNLLTISLVCLCCFFFPIQTCIESDVFSILHGFGALEAKERGLQGGKKPRKNRGKNHGVMPWQAGNFFFPKGLLEEKQISWRSLELVITIFV